MTGALLYSYINYMIMLFPDIELPEAIGARGFLWWWRF